ncbi:MAG: serine hydrolase domain-containing protein [Roseimicrobium sp.]
MRAEVPGAQREIALALQPFVERQALAGAVALVADKDKVLSITTVGHEDIAAKQSMRPESLFWIASMSKTITAAAVMMLVDEGKIRLDDPVEKYLSEFKGQMVTIEKDDNHLLLKKPANPITLRNVLSHTSGLPFKSAMEEPTLDALPLRDAVRSYAMTSLTFEPDSGYTYSNAGINTAARVLEVVSGMAYEDFMQQRVFEPLGMKDTTFWPSEAQLLRLASAYKPNAAKNGLEATTISQLQYPLNNRAKRYPMPAGGLFSSAGDVARFCQMLLRGGEFGGQRLLSEEAVKEMSRRQTGESLKQSYGLGCATGNGVFGHGGALATDMSIDTTRGLVTVWLVQHAGFPHDGAKAKDVFKQAAQASFATK